MVAAVGQVDLFAAGDRPARARRAGRGSPSGSECFRKPSGSGSGETTERQNRSFRCGSGPVGPRSLRVISSSSTMMRPDVGASRPAISPSKVDLPLPDAPVTATNWPSAISTSKHRRESSGPRSRSGRFWLHFLVRSLFGSAEVLFGRV